MSSCEVGLVEDAHDDLLAEHRGQRPRRGSPSPCCRRSCSLMRPSCGSAALGDVELGHDLEARHDGRPTCGAGTADGLVAACRRCGRRTCMSSCRARSGCRRRRGEIAPLSTELTSLMIGAWSLEPRSVTSLVGAEKSTSLDSSMPSSNRVREVVAELDAEAVDVVVGGDDQAHRHARDHRDVVDRQHVGRVGHGEQELALVVLADRDRVVNGMHEAGVDNGGPDPVSILKIGEDRPCRSARRARVPAAGA